MHMQGRINKKEAALRETKGVEMHHELKMGKEKTKDKLKEN